MRRLRISVACIFLLLCLSVIAIPGAVSAETAVGNQTESDSTVEGEQLTFDSASLDAESQSYSAIEERTDIELTQELSRLVEQKGVFLASHEYEIPSQATVLEVTLPEQSTVRTQDGFIQEDGRTYRWDGSTEKPRIEYELQANRSVDQTGPIAGPGRLTFADVGEWGVVLQPATSHRWGWRGPERVGFDRDVTVDGPGAVGDVIAFLGDHDELSQDAHGQQFRLIVPERASLAEATEDIFDSLAVASDTLRVGERDEEVFMIATPSENIDWGVRGLQTGPADMWVRDVERLNDPDNVWLHEYVHTRQGYTTATDLRWFTEATATYYGALLTLQQERIEFEQFRDRLAVGTDQRRFRGSVMTEPDTWRSNANYHVGALTAGKVDKLIRGADTGQSLQEVFRQLNAREDVVTRTTFEDAVEEVGDDSVAERAVQLTTTTERATLWEQSRHRELFGPGLDPARITFTLSEDRPTEVSGAFRNRSLAAGEAPILVPGERLRFSVDATNFGEQSGPYESILRVNDEAVATESGQLAAGESTSLTFGHTFDLTGEYRLTVGDATVDVSVREPAAVSVGAVSINRSEVRAGEGIELSVPVSNPAERPAGETVTISKNGEAIHSETVRLDVDGERLVTVPVRLDQPGTYVFEATGTAESAVLTVVDETSSEDTTGGVGGGTDIDADGETSDGTGTADGEQVDDTGSERATPDDQDEEQTPPAETQSGVGIVVVGLLLALATALITFGWSRDRGSI